MKLIQTLILSLACCSSLGTVPIAFSSEPEPTPTPHEQPSATPHDEPSPTPHGDSGGDDSGGGNDDQTGDDNGGADDGNHDAGNEDHGGLSLHGLYEGTTLSGGLAVMYVESNTHIQINILDLTGQEIDFAEGTLTNGGFAFTLTNGQAISGTANENAIAVVLGGQAFTAAHVESFGIGSSVGGRYVGVAQGPTGASTVMFIIDAANNIIMVQNAAGTRSGGYGTVTAPAGSSTTYSFNLDHVIGSSGTISGTFTIVDGVFSGSFTTSAGAYTVTSFNQSLANHMANISTRGLIGSGQAQLIGGFIISGGPKMVMIRALGPSLAALGVSPVVANPSLQLFAGSSLLASNDDWGSNSNAAQIAGSSLAPGNQLEPALLVRLEPGAYTTVVTNPDPSPAIALVEIYEMGSD